MGRHYAPRGGRQRLRDHAPRRGGKAGGVILLPKSQIVNNMHEAYRRIKFNDYGYGTFISGPSKTADIAQVLVMGAQAARSATVLLIDE